MCVCDVPCPCHAAGVCVRVRGAVLGPDGHIASLFPPVPEALLGDGGGSDAVVAHTTTGASRGPAMIVDAAAQLVPDRFAVFDRITLTMTAILRASAHVFLLKVCPCVGRTHAIGNVCDWDATGSPSRSCGTTCWRRMATPCGATR